MDGDIAPYTTVFRVGERNKVTRNRQAISCWSCQRRKMKCDRQHPCGACERRGEADDCKFSAKAVGANSTRKEVQQRLNQLEALVKDLADRSSSSASPDGAVLKPPSIVTTPPVNPEEGGLQYKGPTAWRAIVNSIRDLQDMMDDEELAPPDDDDRFEEEDLFLGSAPPISMQEVLDNMPSRADADRVISAYFSAKFQAVPFIHTLQFRRRYEAFMANPSSSGFLWISTLFSVLSAGAKIARAKFANEPNLLPSVGPPRLYTKISAQCLAAGQYLKNKTGSVEALLMHVHSRNVLRLDSDAVIWAIYGLTVRLAQRQGYHRDAIKILPDITPFEAEMRRRIWFMIQSSDLLFSFQNGMPAMVHEATCDAGHPTNLADEDFDEDTKVLPQARPPTHPTPILAYSTKSRLCLLTRKIMRHALAVELPPYEETMKLNAELDIWYAALPACLRFTSIPAMALTDPTYTVLHRLMLELMFRKSQMVLNRPYLSVGKGDARYDEARRICRFAYMTMLRWHHDLDHAVSPGGKMYADRFMVSGVCLQHFMIATTIGCLDLSESQDLPCVLLHSHTCKQHS